MKPSAQVLALLGLAASAGTALAQSNVTIYGVADAALEVYDPRGGGDRTLSIISGGRSGSRLGFRGSEDLGGGLNAIFTLEQGYSIDTGELRQGGRAWGRQAFVGLKGSFGTVALGRIPAFSAGSGAFDLIGDLDPFGTSFGAAGMGSTLSSAAGLRTDNTVTYLSPNLSGLQAGLAHSLQFDGNEVAGSSNNVHMTMAALRYDAGPFGAALTYDVANNPAGGSDESHLQAAVAYDLKMVKLFAAFALEKDQFNPDFNVTGTESGADAKAWMLGVSAPLGSGIVRTSFQSRDADDVGGDERDLTVFSIGYEHLLSKRTSLYVYHVDARGKKTLKNDPDYDRRILTAGIYHRF